MIHERDITLDRGNDSYPLLVTYTVEEPDRSVGDSWPATLIDDVQLYTPAGLKPFDATAEELEWLAEQMEWT